MFTSLDVIHTAVYYAANRKLKDSETLALVETAIYCATVDKQNQVLQVIFVEVSSVSTQIYYEYLGSKTLKATLALCLSHQINTTDHMWTENYSYEYQ